MQSTSSLHKAMATYPSVLSLCSLAFKPDQRLEDPTQDFGLLLRSETISQQQQPPPASRVAVNAAPVAISGA